MKPTKIAPVSHKRSFSTAQNTAQNYCSKSVPAGKKKKRYTHEYRDYRDKNAILQDACTLVTPKEFYDDIFPDSDLERVGHPEDRHANMIIAYRDTTPDGKALIRNEVVFSGKEGLHHANKNAFALCGLCTYSGRRKTAVNARLCYGFVFDLDGVGAEECKTFLLGVQVKKLPCPQYIVNSGHGLHLYYIFEHPVPLYPAVRERLQRLKRALTRVVWTNETSYLKSRPDRDVRDYVGIYQCFRMPGSCSKIGKGKARTKYLVTAYRYNTYRGARCSLSYLSEWVDEADRVPLDPDYSSWDYSEDHVSLAEAKKQWPDWYQKRIVEQLPADQWTCNHGLYDWWLNRIQQSDGARDGTRYNCVSVLFIYAIKCAVPFSEALADALELVPFFDELTVKPDNAFTPEDVYAASKFYKRSYARYSIRAIELKTHIQLPRNKRNGRSQEKHLAGARAIQAIDDPEGNWRNKEGAPKKRYIVQQWRADHPGGRKADCIRETGLSKPTVYKWWDTDFSS